jgi:hypothetical protein
MEMLLLPIMAGISVIALIAIIAVGLMLDDMQPTK